MNNKLVEEAINWFNANKAKNEAQSAERKALEQAKKAYGDLKEPIEIETESGVKLSIGYVDTESEVIDAKKFFERNPELFWQLVEVPKTNAIKEVGDKEVALCSVTRVKNDFKIQKIKKDA